MYTYSQLESENLLIPSMNKASVVFLRAKFVTKQTCVSFMPAIM